MNTTNTNNVRIFHLVPINNGQQFIVWADNEDAARNAAEVRNNTPVTSNISHENPLRVTLLHYLDPEKCDCIELEEFKDFQIVQQSSSKDIIIKTDNGNRPLTKGMAEFF